MATDHVDNHCTVITFPLPAARLGARSHDCERAAGEGRHLVETPCRGPYSRRNRYRVWRRAETKFDYLSALRAFIPASIVRGTNKILAELDCPKALLAEHGDFSEPGTRDLALVDRLHAAKVDLLLTPAPTVAKLNWKRKQFARGQYLAAEARRIERAIAADVAWLDAHQPRGRRR